LSRRNHIDRFGCRSITHIEKERSHVLISVIGMPEVGDFGVLKRVRALGHDRCGMPCTIELAVFARAEDCLRALRAGFFSRYPNQETHRSL